MKTKGTITDAKATKKISAAQLPQPKKKVRKPPNKHVVSNSRHRSKAKQAAPRTAVQYLAKPERFKSIWDRVINVISKMRAEKVSLTQASRGSGISPRTVVRWGGPAIEKRKNGKYVAKPKDNLLRILKIPTPEGTRDIALRGSQKASMLGEYWNAVHRYLETGDASQLENFHDKQIKDSDGREVALTTDHAVLNRLASAGVLSFESLYARSS